MIRRAQAEDVAALVTIYADSFESPWSSDTMARMVESCDVFVVGNPICGFVIVKSVLDEAEIISLAIAPQARKSGNAKVILVHMLGHLKTNACTRVFLEVAADNAPARALYDSLGFSQIGMRKAYYPRLKGPSIDALVLGLSL